MTPSASSRRVRHMRGGMLGCVACACLLPAAAIGQRKAAREANGWNAPTYDLASIAPAAARAEARRQVERFLDVLRATPQLAAPEFPIYTSVHAAVEGEGHAAPAVYDVRVAFYRPGMVGKVMDDQVRLQGNDPGTVWDTEQPQSAHVFGDRELYMEPRFDRTWHGYPMNARGYIVVARAGRRLFRPVSVKDYYGLLTAQLRAKERAGEGAVYAEILGRVQQKYAALSPAVLAEPAYACMDDIDEDTFLCKAGGADPRRLVEFDPAYWDRSAGRTALQLLVLYRYNPDFRTGPVGVALTDAWERLDWSAWRGLLGSAEQSGLKPDPTTDDHSLRITSLASTRMACRNGR